MKLRKISSTLSYIGPGLDEGPLPALFYFALTAEKNLTCDPFNQPVVALQNLPMRVFSITLPYHGGDIKEQEAVDHWRKELEKGSNFLDEFLDETIQTVDRLVQEGWIDTKHISAMGLSRGGFIAAHLAARDPRFKTLLGFAPLTTLRVSKWDLISITDKLSDRTIRFYIGNRDERVSTKSCFEFIEAVTEASFQNGIRSPEVELIIFPSIGHKGHGTPPEIFSAGADWYKKRSGC